MEDLWLKLPEDIMFEILRRLPEVDLMASKLVCKDWNFVISMVCIPSLSESAPLAGLLTFKDLAYKPNFIPMGRYFFGQYSRRFILCQTTLWDDILSLSRWSPDPAHHSEEILDCCNGLLLLQAATTTTSQYYYIVGNPVTKQLIRIPAIPSVSNSNSRRINTSSLVFDPSRSLGFKIVISYTTAAAAADDDHSVLGLEVDVFSSLTGEWSSHALPPQDRHLYGFRWIRRPVYFQGALYYISKALYLVCIENVLLQRNDNNSSSLEVWAIELPDLQEQECGCIGNSSGHFYYSNRSAQNYSVLVWMLVGKGRSSEWVLRHNISIAHDIVYLLHGMYENVVNWSKKLESFRPRAFDPNDDQIFMAASRILIYFHLKTKQLSVCHIPLPEEGNILLDQNLFMPFRRCLLLLNNIATPRLEIERFVPVKYFRKC